MLFNTDFTSQSKDVPITLFESELHIVEDSPTLIFVATNFTVETFEAERVSVDHIVKMQSAGSGSCKT